MLSGLENLLSFQLISLKVFLELCTAATQRQNHLFVLHLNLGHAFENRHDHIRDIMILT